MSDATLENHRQDLDRLSGREYWQRLEQIAAQPAFREILERDFPSQRWRWDDGSSRRDFLRLMGASLALAGLTNCTRQPEEKIVPASRSPESTIPGIPRYFATTMPALGGGLGLLVESHSGRPTKVEGNPEHPASLGATSNFAQAEILSLYDPERSRVVLHGGRISTYGDFLTELKTKMDEFTNSAGKGLVVMTEEVLSPTLAAQIENLLVRYPQAKHVVWQPVQRDTAAASTSIAFGRPLSTQYHLDKATVIATFDADLLQRGPGAVRYAKDFGRRRQPGVDAPRNRLYCVEPTPTATGSLADHRISAAPELTESLLFALAAELNVQGVEFEDHLSADMQRFVKVLAEDLRAHSGQCLVAVGEYGEGLSQDAHVVAHEINFVLGNIGQTVTYTDSIPRLRSSQPLQDLVLDLRSGAVDSLIVLGGNPVYNVPPIATDNTTTNFAELFQKAKFRVHLSSHEDETSRLCHWHIPESHFLESWGDCFAFDGTRSVTQPLIAPLYPSRTALELVNALLGESGRNPREAIVAHWQQSGWLAADAATAEREFQTVLHDGLAKNSAWEAVAINAIERKTRIVANKSNQETLRILFRPDSSTLDGRYANNGWLQETPRVLTRLTWGNAILVSPAFAASRDLNDGDVVRLSVDQQSVEGPIWTYPGQADQTITLPLGYGRTAVGRVGNDVGFNAYLLQRNGGQRITEPGQRIQLEKTGATAMMACVQDHARMEGRNLVRQLDQNDPAAPHAANHGGHDVSELSMYEDREYNDNAWGMVIDLSSCLGCNACMVACQSENNIPIVGKEEVEKGRELHWIRIDRYYEGDADKPVILHQPVPCMQCENAPCEVVCPVGATVHSSEGLNDMVYNRCVGTRYCSNNCPYKVRRFNFFGYSDYQEESLKLGRNPDVTVRTRGVMEKCTYCVQRINAARITAKKEGRPIADGEITTACQGACPTEAVTFGDINNADSKIARLREQDHHYALLEELGARPRTTYLARVTNKNPKMQSVDGPKVKES